MRPHHFSHLLKDLYCHLCFYVTWSSVALDSYFFFAIIYFLTASLLQLSKSDPSPLLCIFLSLTLLSLPSAVNPSAPNSPWPLQPLPFQELRLLGVIREKLQNYANCSICRQAIRVMKILPVSFSWFPSSVASANMPYLHFSHTALYRYIYSLTTSTFSCLSRKLRWPCKRYLHTLILPFPSCTSVLLQPDANRATSAWDLIFQVCIYHSILSLFLSPSLLVFASSPPVQCFPHIFDPRLI